MLKKWERDKWKHFYVGICLGILLQAAAIYFFQISPVFSGLLVFTALLAICYGFELFSLLTGRGHYELMDAFAGIIGGTLGMGLAWLFVLVKNA
ncbi:MAG: hypothetical protein ABI741_07195 [Ferruginibacter sp.]